MKVIFRRKGKTNRKRFPKWNTWRKWGFPPINPESSWLFISADSKQ